MRLITTIHRAHQAVKDVMSTMLTDEGVTPTQLIVLHALAENEYPNQSKLVLATGIDRSTMTDVITRLARNGYIVRRQMRRDARVKTPRITHKGRMVVVRSMVSIPRIEAEVQARIPEVRALRQQLGGKMKKAA